jgi:acetyltransferase-like isoleucine patch superfamily enzyme
MLIKIYRRIIIVKTKLLSLYWRSLFNKFGEGSKVFGSIKVYNPDNVFFGSKSTLNYGALLNARDKIIIGDNVHISPYVIINTGGLDYSKVGDNRNHIKKEVIIKDGV